LKVSGELHAQAALPRKEPPLPIALDGGWAPGPDVEPPPYQAVEAYRVARC
jgi:hypothetical protein